MAKRTTVSSQTALADERDLPEGFSSVAVASGVVSGGVSGFSALSFFFPKTIGSAGGPGGSVEGGGEEEPELRRRPVVPELVRVVWWPQALLRNQARRPWLPAPLAL